MTSEAGRNSDIESAMNRGGLIDITTNGRKSGNHHRIECLLYHIDGHYYISGRPDEKKRDWLANLEADGNFTLHLKQGVSFDLPAQARPITDPEERKTVLQTIPSVGQEYPMPDRVRLSPLVEVTLKETRG